MFLIGLTGGIATGKSTVCEMMAEEGVPIVDADLIARDVVAMGEPAYDALRKEFGSEVFQDNGDLDRGKLGALIFEDETKRKAVNKITHPRIYARMRRQILGHFLNGEQFVVLDLPLLFETETAVSFCHKTIVVACDGETQVSRLCQRGGYTKGQAMQRIDCQLPLSLKCDLAAYVVENSAALVETRRQVRGVVSALRASNQHLINRALLLLLLTATLLLVGYLLNWLLL